MKVIDLNAYRERAIVRARVEVLAAHAPVLVRVRLRRRGRSSEVYASLRGMVGGSVVMRALGNGLAWRVGLGRILEIAPAADELRASWTKLVTRQARDLARGAL